MLIYIFSHVLLIYFYIPKSPILYWIKIYLYFNSISMFQTIYHNKDEAILFYFYYLILCTFTITYPYQSSSW
jgi:ABC-type sulfate transport system permease subunit